MYDGLLNEIKNYQNNSNVADEYSKQLFNCKFHGTRRYKLLVINISGTIHVYKVKQFKHSGKLLKYWLEFIEHKSFQNVVSNSDIHRNVHMEECCMHCYSFCELVLIDKWIPVCQNCIQNIKSSGKILSYYPKLFNCDYNLNCQYVWYTSNDYTLNLWCESANNDYDRYVIELSKEFSYFPLTSCYFNDNKYRAICPLCKSLLIWKNSDRPHECVQCSAIIKYRDSRLKDIIISKLRIFYYNSDINLDLKDYIANILISIHIRP